MMNFGSIPFVAQATPLPAGSSAYLSETYTPSGGSSTVITRPAGATSAHTLTAVLFGNAAGIETQAAPSGWTAGDGVVLGSNSARLYTAPGDVATLTFAHPVIAGGVACFATTAPLKAGYSLVQHDYSTGAATNQPTPSITAVAGDLIVSLYIQQDDGTGGELVGPVQAEYTTEFQVNVADTPPYVSFLSRAGVAAGATGTVSHGADGTFSTRYLLTAAF